MARPTQHITRDIKDFPFHKIREAYVLGLREYKDHLMRQYSEFILGKEREWNATHEAPYEGNFSEMYPEPKLSIQQQNTAGFSGMRATLTSLGLPVASSWLLPQLLNYLNETVTLVKNTSGLIDGRETVARWVARDQDRHLGMLYIMTYPTRSAIIKSQTALDGRDFCTLVPLFLSAFKKYRNVGYSEWDPTTLGLIVAQPLLDAMTCGPVAPITTTELVQLRVDGIMAAAKHKLLASVVASSPLAKLPDNAVAMLCQIWVADPAIRTKYMVLDPDNWDNIPLPLISLDMFNSKDEDLWGTQYTHKEVPPVAEDIPWQ